MKLNLREWNQIVAALDTAQAEEGKKRNLAAVGGDKKAEKAAYVAALTYGELRDKIAGELLG
jgi:hypothetical protein